MKLHEKILTHYLSCTSPVDKEGYLYKKKERNATYRRRWFVLKANLLFYQERPGDRHLLGVIVLEGCSVRRSESDVEFAFSLVFEGPGLKTYRFAARDGQTQESWVQTLVSASHCYLSLLVGDLGRQYEDNQGNICRLRLTPFVTRFPLLQKPNSNRAPEGPVPRAPGPNSPPATSPSPRRGRPPRSDRGGASVPARFYKPRRCPPRRWLKSPLSPLEDFGKLHDHYGQEVKRAREEWLRSRRAR
uniref:Sesquipedalian n=1 Tax=Gasterosteus aculeatus TaxID=69293 RepID=G3PK91_GASAC